MLQMIIADDDRLIRESLSRLIDWTSHGISVSAVARTGEEALNQVLTLRPDILLTDIEMPHMTGTQLLKTLRQENIPCEVIFLSAYSNFAYAQEAVRYGAFNYLLKPVDESQLINTVTRCRNQILLRQNELQLLSQDKQIHTMACTSGLKSLILQNSQSGDSLADAQLLHIIGFPQDENTSIGAICLTMDSQGPEDARLTMDSRELEAACLSVRGLECEDGFPANPRPETGGFCADTKGRISGHPTGNISHASPQLLPLSSTETMLLFLAPTPSSNRLCQYMEQYAERLLPFIPAEARICVSTVHTCRQIGRLYPECCFARLLTRFYGDKAVSLFRQVQSVSEDSAPMPGPGQLLSLFREDGRNIDSALKSLFLSFIPNGMLYNLHDMKLRCLSLLDGLGRESNPFSCSAADWESDFMFSFKKDILACGSVTALYEAMVRILYRLFVHSLEENSPKSRLVHKTLQYIRENYAHATLSDVSATLYISPSYLSRLFASEMDESFSRYLMRYRINIAKEKLRNPEAKLYAIAESVGYSDLAHFSKAFKLIEGISPGKYRKEYGGL